MPRNYRALPAIVALAVCACAPQTTEPDRLVYSAYTPSNWDIYLFTQAGGSAQPLTTHPALDYEPTISPDGRWVVFTSERDGSPDLWVIDLRDVESLPRKMIASGRKCPLAMPACAT